MATHNPDKLLSVEEVDKMISEIEKKQAHAEVDKQIASQERKQAAKDGIILSADLTPEQINIGDICALINKAVPILNFVNGLLWWKPKWQKIIKEVIAIAGSVCS